MFGDWQGDSFGSWWGRLGLPGILKIAWFNRTIRKIANFNRKP